MNIIQIVPRMLPAKDGMSDYALVLADGLRKCHDISTRFLTCHSDEGRSDINGFPVIKMTWTGGGFLEAVRTDVSIDAIVLHYSFFFYNPTKYGAPFWLLHDLKEFLKKHNVRLVAVFHELPYIKSTRFLDPIKSYVAKRMARMADTVVTPCEKLARILKNWTGRPVIVTPVFSNIADPENNPPIAARRRRMVVFGGISRFRVYQNSFPTLINACRLMGINEICDIGPLWFGPSALGKNPNHRDVVVKEMGIQTAEEISKIMSDSMAGFFESSRFKGYLGKSGVFAAYCAHGMVPVTDRNNYSDADGTKHNKHYWIADLHPANFSPSELQAIADNAHHWYETHDRKKTADLFAALLLRGKVN